MGLPGFGFTRKDKIFLSIGALVLSILTISFIAFLNIKVEEKTNLSKITPEQAILSRQQTVSPTMIPAVSKTFTPTASAGPSSAKKRRIAD